jgi:hypothetical protein
MNKTRKNQHSSVNFFLSWLFLFAICCPSGVSWATDAEVPDTTGIAATIYSSTLILNLPQLAVEGNDLLYSAQLQLKQGGEKLFLELVGLGISSSQQTSVTTAVLSNDGTLHIPLLDMDDASLWTADLVFIPSEAPLPIRFGITGLNPIPEIETNDNMVGAMRCTVISQGKIGNIVYCCDSTGRNCSIWLVY